jgi:hypothetical protein
MRSLLRNVRTDNTLFFLLVAVSIVVWFEGVYTLATGQPLRQDTTPPTINSSVDSVPACFTTLIKPSITVEEPRLWPWQFKSGLKVARIYVGSDLVGEWHVPNTGKEAPKTDEPLDLKGVQYERRVSATQGPIFAVAEDFQGNTTIKVVGSYKAPHCLSGIPSREAKCECPNQAMEGLSVLGDATEAPPEQIENSSNVTEPENN